MLLRRHQRIVAVNLVGEAVNGATAQERTAWSNRSHRVVVHEHEARVKIRPLSDFVMREETARSAHVWPLESIKGAIVELSGIAAPVYGTKSPPLRPSFKVLIAGIERDEARIIA